MKTLLVTLNAKFIHTSLALRYLRAYTLPEHQTVLLEYSINEPIDKIAQGLLEQQPDVIALSCYIWNIEQTLELIRLLHQLMPELTIIVGGPEVSYELEDWLEREPAIDFIVYGEGEQSLKELLDYIQGTRELRDLKGVAYRLNEAIVIAESQKLLQLDTIPSPYQHEDLSKLKNRVVYFEASRGCPFACSYCLSSLDNRVRFFSIERVKADLTLLLEAGIRLIKFVDRTFNIKQDYAMEIFEFLVDYHNEHSSETVFQFEITADLLSDELINYLNENVPKGLFRFEIGVQSTNEQTNRLINRKQDWERLNKNVHRLQTAGTIELHLDLIAGLPEEDYASFCNSFNQVFALGATELQLGFLKVLRGTQIWLEQELYGYQFDKNPPYEVLDNNVLSVDDIAAIKLVEQMLNRYWNTGYLRTTIKYLTDQKLSGCLTPFDFFLQLGQYWQSQGYSPIDYQLEDLYSRLYQFLAQKQEVGNSGDLDDIDLLFVYDLMKYEFFTRFKHKPRRVWWPYKFDKEKQTATLEKLAEHPELAGNDFVELGLTKQQMQKQLMLDQLQYDIPQYLMSGAVRRQSLLQIIYFDFVNDSRVYFARI
jgi:anaerobic magnesium-protoporphyrin IX monomethyl ester cyclase